MGRLKVVSSGSAGNSYIVEAGGETLLLELGVPFAVIKKALHYDISKIAGCLVSHEHQDHALSVDKARQYQLKVFTPEELRPKKMYRLGGFNIMPLAVPHGDCRCYSYWISHKDIGTMLFATDLSFFPYNLKDINHILLECNYADEIIIDNAMENRFSRSHSENHMSLENCIKTLKRMNGDSVQNIVLLHISHSNGDPRMFVDRVFDEIGIRPKAASQDLEMELSKEEF